MEELRVQGLRKQIGALTLAADFTVKAGERVGIIGPSGCGKTSLLRAVSGLDRKSQDQGQVFLGPDNITGWPAERRQIGMVFQEASLFPGLNVLENAAFGLRMQGLAKKERDERALVWLDKVGLRALANSSVENLSGGEKQRIAFVRAIVWKPRALLLDEPFSALDAELREGLRRELVELHQLWPVPLLFVTHDQADLNAVVTRTLQFSGSRVSDS